MAFDTYAELQAEIVDWLHRPNLTAKVPGFIRLAEAEINRKLNMGPREIEVPLATVVGSRFIARPGDMSRPIALWLEHVQPRQQLTLVLPEAMSVRDGAGAATYWAIDGETLALNVAADQTYPLTFRYLQDTTLSDANPTTELLRRAPDVYLYGALAQAAPFMRDDNRTGMWKSEFARLLADVRAEYSRTRSAAPVTTDVPVSFLSR